MYGLMDETATGLAATDGVGEGYRTPCSAADRLGHCHRRVWPGGAAQPGRKRAGSETERSSVGWRPHRRAKRRPRERSGGSDDLRRDARVPPGTARRCASGLTASPSPRAESRRTQRASEWTDRGLVARGYDTGAGQLVGRRGCTGRSGSASLASADLEFSGRHRRWNRDSSGHAWGRRPGTRPRSPQQRPDHL